MIAKPNKNKRPKLFDAPHPKPELNESEYRFDRLDETEYEDCFRYEIHRCRLPLLRASIQEELASIAADAKMPVEPEDFEGIAIARKPELEGQLEELKEYELPWLELRRAGIPPFLRGGKRLPKPALESVQVIGRINAFTRAQLLIDDRTVEKLQIVITVIP